MRCAIRIAYSNVLSSKNATFVAFRCVRRRCAERKRARHDRPPTDLVDRSVATHPGVIGVRALAAVFFVGFGADEGQPARSFGRGP